MMPRARLACTRLQQTSGRQQLAGCATSGRHAMEALRLPLPLLAALWGPLRMPALSASARAKSTLPQPCLWQLLPKKRLVSLAPRIARWRPLAGRLPSSSISTACPLRLCLRRPCASRSDRSSSGHAPLYKSRAHLPRTRQ